MRNDRHLEDKELVQFLDRELPRRGYAGAREHVRTCWTCHARFSELQSITEEIVRLDQKLALLDGSEWPDFGVRLRESRRAMGSGAPHGWAAMPFWARLALASATLASLAVAYSLVERWNRPATPAPPPPAPRTAPVRPGSPVPSERAAAAVRAVPRIPASLGTELSVIRVLHHLGADTGEPVQVTALSGGAVQVTCKGLPQERETELRAALSGLPGVAVRFEQPSMAGVEAADGATPMTFGVRRPAFAGVLEAAAGGASNLETLTNGLLDESEEMMAAAHALNLLAQRFPANRRQGMNTAEAAVLAEIERDHTAALGTHFRRIEAMLAPFHLEKESSLPSADGTGLFDSARGVQRALNAIFGGSEPEGPLPAMLAELASANRQMERTMEAAQ